MSSVYRYGATTMADQPWERSRLEWRVGDPGDPAALLEEFLHDHGLPVRNLATPQQARASGTLLISAAAGAVMVGAPVGPPTPAPAVPDLVAVIWEPRRRHQAAQGNQAHRAAGPWRVGRWRPSWSTARHARAVAEVRAAIARGDVYQVNVVGHASARYQGDPEPALRRLAGLPGTRYPIVLWGEGWWIATASPETLIEVAGGQVTTRPIKGTRPATGPGRAELLSSTKERAEHVMIVDLERNDLARVARTGSVRVTELFALRRWCELWQAESTVSAALADGVGLADLLRAVLPGGSVTGAPKLAALELIGALEPVGRGPSMGALGWVGPDGIDLGLTIRTAAADRDRLHLWTGGGITWGSDPEAEVAEAAAKADPLLAALAGR
jgi:para-aminobenzoate synthetase component 1